MIYLSTNCTMYALIKLLQYSHCIQYIFIINSYIHLLILILLTSPFSDAAALSCQGDGRSSEEILNGHDDSASESATSDKQPLLLSPEAQVDSKGLFLLSENWT